MTKYLCILSAFLICLFMGCKRSSDSINDIQNVNTFTQTKNDTAYFYLSDTLGNIQTHFQIGEDIIFNLGIINNQDTVLTFTKSHGGLPIVSFMVFKADTLFGISDEGYVYPAIISGGAIFPKDTLEYSVSWDSNPYHQNIFVTGTYSTSIYSYIWFKDFNLYNYMDTLYFEIVDG